MQMQSESIGKLAEALSLAQAEFKPALKDSKNPFFKSNYADLASIVDASRTALTKHGLAVIQATTFFEGFFCLHTILSHKSGEYISGLYPLKPVKDDPQGQGSCITYAKRYAYAAICGVTTDDDDGEAAHGRAKSEVQKMGEPVEIYNGAVSQKEIVKAIFGKYGVPMDLMSKLNGFLMSRPIRDADGIVKDFMSKHG